MFLTPMPEYFAGIKKSRSPVFGLCEMGLEETFLEFCRNESEGASEAEFRAKHPEYDTTAVAMAINQLCAQGLIELLKRGNELICKAVSADDVEIAANLEGDEKIVYQCIKAADNKGIWTKDLKMRTNLHQTVITKVLKNLENRKIIKAVKSVKNSTRKVYMLANLEPSQEITGGPWFSENELDTEFIEELCKVCLRFIGTKSVSPKPGHVYPADYTGYPTLEQVHRFLRDSRVTSAELETEDVSMLLDRLIFDGSLERVVWAGPRISRIVDDDDDDGDIYVYRAVSSALPESMMAGVPCGQCPVFDACSDIGPITPATCTYYAEWLSF